MFDSPHEDAPLGKYLEPKVSGSRIERNRAAIHARLGSRRGVQWVWVTAMASGLAVASWLLFGPSLQRGADDQSVARMQWDPGSKGVLNAGDMPFGAELSDGTHVDLQPQTDLEARRVSGNAVDLELRRGGASFDVSHNPERRFRVHAGEVTVTVLGTRFSVTRDDERVQVAVERGKVAVDDGAGVAFLLPGERWSGGTTRTRVASSVAPSGADAPLVVEPAASAEETASDVHSGPDSPPATARSGAPLQPRETSPAKELFDASREARRSGDSRRAAQLLQELVSSYPGDPRAGLAAFELGRIRADVLGDNSGAARALEQALKLSPRAGYRQDALARLTQAYERSGRTAACKAVRQKYLAAYGEGIHAQRVLKLCP